MRTKHTQPSRQHKNRLIKQGLILNESQLPVTSVKNLDSYCPLKRLADAMTRDDIRGGVLPLFTKHRM